jgi:hypothetical protein
MPSFPQPAGSFQSSYPVNEEQSVAKVVSIWKQPSCGRTWQVCGRVVGYSEAIPERDLPVSVIPISHDLVNSLRPKQEHGYDYPREAGR